MINLRWQESTNAVEWAEAFVRQYSPDLKIDVGLMLGWFSNAIQRGADWKEQTHLHPLKKELNHLSDQLKRHVEMYSEMPMRVAEMTERERALFQMLAADRGMIKFMQTHLRELAKRNVDLDASP